MKKTVFVALLSLFTLLLPVYAEDPPDYTNPYPAPPASSTPSYDATPAKGPTRSVSGASYMNYSSQNNPSDRDTSNNEDLRHDYPQEKGMRSDYPQEKRRAVSADGRAKPIEPSSIEKALYGDMTPVRDARPQAFSADHLQQFGYSFFRTDSDGFAPVTDIPVGPDYIIGVGDKIILTLWGSIEGKYQLEVNRNGEITLPRVGTVIVAGVNYVQLKEVIHALLAKVFKDFQLDVNIGKLRHIKVYLVGEVGNPGDYNLTSLATVINALSAAGGPTKNGSLRNIRIKRNGKLVETIDLYDFFLKGDKSKDIRLQSGDTVFVPTIGPVAGITGNVRRPAIYELRDEKSLKDVLSLADGINSGGYLQRIQISRIIAHEKKIVSDFNLDPVSTGKSADELTGSITIQDMDVVKVFPIDPILRGSVRLEGYVLRPGSYSLKPGMRIKDILSRDNLLPEYYQEVGEITRLYLPDYHPEKMIFNPSRAITGDPAHNLELQEFDVVKIFSRWEMEEMPKVRISGEVQKPGEYRLFKNMTVRDLLLLAGNPKLTAYMKNADITRIKKTGESVTSFSININLDEAIRDNPQHNIPLEQFDELIVRKIPNWTEETERYITLKGEFRFPGKYPIFKGEKLSSAIERAGGFTDKAYLRAAKFTRESVREQQQKRMDEMIFKTEQEIVKKQALLASVASSKEEVDATRAALDGLKRSVDLLKTVKAEGRLVIRMSKLDKFKDSPYNVELLGGDVLDVPQKPNAVNVLGQVYNPTSIIPIGKDDVEFYLAKVGGPNRDADEGGIYIVRVDGTVQSRQQVSFLRGLFSSGFMSTILGPGDTIIVPMRYENIAWMREIKDITSILANVALTAGVMVAAGL
jgi:protein involved in polysaccharide export with SLBB domain